MNPPLDHQAFISLLRLVASECPTHKKSLLQRKRNLLKGLSGILSADSWVWMIGAAEPYPHVKIAPIAIVDGGWKDRSERAVMISRFLDPVDQRRFLTPIMTAIRAGATCAFLRQDLIEDEAWQVLDSASGGEDFKEFLLATRPLNSAIFSAVCLLRRATGAPFTTADRELLKVVMTEIDWLHASNVNAEGARNALGMPPRVRETLVHLLAGGSKKEIAALMELSQHTVGDYLKVIYRHFQVAGRGELFAKIANLALSVEDNLPDDDG